MMKKKEETLFLKRYYSRVPIGGSATFFFISLLQFGFGLGFLVTSLLNQVAVGPGVSKFNVEVGMGVFGVFLIVMGSIFWPFVPRRIEMRKSGLTMNKQLDLGWILNSKFTVDLKNIRRIYIDKEEVTVQTLNYDCESFYRRILTKKELKEFIRVLESLNIPIEKRDNAFFEAVGPRTLENWSSDGNLSKLNYRLDERMMMPPQIENEQNEYLEKGGKFNLLKKEVHWQHGFLSDLDRLEFKGNSKDHRAVVLIVRDIIRGHGFTYRLHNENIGSEIEYSFLIRLKELNKNLKFIRGKRTIWAGLEFVNEDLKSRMNLNLIFDKSHNKIRIEMNGRKAAPMEYDSIKEEIKKRISAH